MRDRVRAIHRTRARASFTSTKSRVLSSISCESLSSAPTVSRKEIHTRGRKAFSFPSDARERAGARISFCDTDCLFWATILALPATRGETCA